MTRIESSIYKYSSLFLSKKISKKIIVIESDDWGSVRMPSKETYNHCLEAGYAVDKNAYTKFDSLETDQDLEELFNLLSIHKDCNGNNPIFTANCLVANPDFEKILESDCKNYYFETVDETFSKSINSKNVLRLWKEGNEEKFFTMQSHGREHLNVARFMFDLEKGNADALFALKNKMPGIFAKNNYILGNEYVVALENSDQDDLMSKCKIIGEGLDLFFQTFGYYSKSYIACNYVWDPEIEKVLNEKKVAYIQGTIFQMTPKGKFNGFKKTLHYTGEMNNQQQTYLVRNAHFEPVYDGQAALNNCLKQINLAFKLNLPAIISTHRINYVSTMDKSNRSTGLKYLDVLFKTILKRWPDVTFMTTTELGNYINDTKK